MSELRTTHPLALHFLLNEDIYRLKQEEEASVPEKVAAPAPDSEVSDLKIIETPALNTEVSEPKTIEAPAHNVAASEAKIIETPAPEPVTPEPAKEDAPPIFNYLGENNRYMLLLVNSPGENIMPAKELEALQSILQAKKLDLKDVAIVNHTHYSSLLFQQLREYFACSTLVLFGVNPQHLKMPDFPPNVITPYEGIKVLSTYSFAEMLGSNDKKRAFWNEMKKL